MREIWVDEGLNGAVFEPPGVDINATDLPCVLLLHGLGGSWRLWRLVAQHLVAKNVCVIAVDLPGFGDSPDMEEGKEVIKGSAERIAKWLERTGHKWTIVGHSYGGAVSSELSLFAPHLIEEVIMVSPAGFLQHPWKGRWQWRHPWYEAVRQLVMREAATLLSRPRLRSRTLGGLMHDPSILDNYQAREIIIWAGWAKAPARAGMELVSSTLANRMKDCIVPMRLIWGQNDKVIPISQGHWMAGQLSLDLIIYNDAAHLIPLESPGRLAEDVAHWMQTGNTISVENR